MKVYIITWTIIIVSAIIVVVLGYKFLRYCRKPNDVSRNFSLKQLLALIVSDTVFIVSMYFLVDVRAFDMSKELFAIDSSDILFYRLIPYVIFPLLLTVGSINKFCKAKGIK